ncbi:MAG: hypothetical protein AB1847_11460 [bacterium]
MLKRKGLIAIFISLALLQGNSIPAKGVLGGRRKLSTRRQIRPPVERNTEDINTADNGMDRSCGGLDLAVDREDWLSRIIHIENFPSARAGAGDRKADGFPVAGKESIAGAIRRRKKAPAQENEKAPDHNPAVASDNEGNIYLVWEHGNELFWAVNKGGTWTGSGKVPGTGGSHPVLISIPRIPADNAPIPAGQDATANEGQGSGSQKSCACLFCAWESLTSTTKIMGSKGTLTTTGIAWSEPQALTGDENGDFCPVLVVDKSQRPVMLWLQRASFDDDSDLYYQVITSPCACPDADQAIVLAPDGGMQATGSEEGSYLPDSISALQASNSQAAASTSTPGGRAAPSTPAGGDPPSNWVGQPAPIDLTGPIPPYLSSNCVAIVLTKATINFPSQIPILGETANLEITGYVCGNSGVSLRGSRDIVAPVAIDELQAVLSFGPHLSLGFNMFALGQVVLTTPGNAPADSEGIGSAVQGTVVTYGGSDSFLYLSNPIPLSACGQQMGSTRLGTAGAIGVSFSFVRAPNNPEIPREFVTQISLGLGPEQTFRSLDSKIQGFLLLAGGYALNYIVPSRSRPTLSQKTFLNLSGALRFGGDWAALLTRFTKTFTLRELGGWGDPNTASNRRWGNWPSVGKKINWGDPNSASYRKVRPFGYCSSYGENEGSDPNSSQRPGQSRKDKLVKTMTSIMEDGNILVDEMMETVKEPLTGTSNVYEGKTVLKDISGDIYNDGIPAVARSGSGEIMVVWVKAFPAQALGTRVYAATYDTEGWSSPVEVTPKIDFHEAPSVAFDSCGTPMVVWSSASNEGLDYEQSPVMDILAAFEKEDLMYSQRVKGKWTEPKPLAKLPGTDKQVDLAAGPNGEIVAVWINQSKKGSCLCGSFWNGTRWTDPAVIARSVLAESPEVIYTAQKPAVIWAQDTDGQIDIAGDWGLYFSRWDGAYWRSLPLSLTSSPSEKDIKKKTLRGLRKNLHQSGKKGGNREE